MAAVAYLPVLLVPGLRVYPAWRQPGLSQKAPVQPLCRVDAYWHLARGQLDVSSVGAGVLPAADGGEIRAAGPAAGNLVKALGAAVGPAAVGGFPGG